MLASAARMTSRAITRRIAAEYTYTVDRRASIDTVWSMREPSPVVATGHASARANPGTRTSAAARMTAQHRPIAVIL
jgi:hypothetical protein